MYFYVFSVIFCTAFIGVTIELIRRRLVLERYAILWLCLGAVMLAFGTFPKLLDMVSEAAGIFYAPSFMFLGGMLFSLLFIMHTSVVLTKLRRHVTRLSQEIALLQVETAKKEEGRDGDSADRSC